MPFTHAEEPGEELSSWFLGGVGDESKRETRTTKPAGNQRIRHKFNQGASKH